MEQCNICGKETPFMQLGVRYCTKCGDSVIPVCQPCGVHPFYCKSCKPRKGWREDKDPDCIGKDGKPKARRHRDVALKAQAKDALNIPMTTNDGQTTAIIKKIELAEKVERDMGRDYPRAQTLKNWMALLQDKKASKIKNLTEEIDHYVKLGLGWGINEPKELQEAIKATYNYAIEKRKAVTPKIDTKPIEELMEHFSRRQYEPYKTITKGFVMLKDLLEQTWLFGLYEETQFRTPKQEINWEIQLTTTRLKKDVFGLSEQVEKKLGEVKKFYNN